MATAQPARLAWEEALAQAPPARSRWADAWRQLRRNKMALFGTLVALAYVLIGVVGPFFAPYPYDQQDLMSSLAPPLSAGHLLGTDQLGRDMLSRLMEAVRISLLVGFGVTFISLLVGTVAGALAGFYRGWTDTIISAIIELTWGFPLILIAVILTGVMGPGLTPMVLAIGLINWAGFARIVRGEVLSLREREFVQAARAAGVRDARLLGRHILPNVVAPTLVMGSYYVALAIIIEAGLSFIGLGAQPPLPSLGNMMADGRNYMLVDQWVTTIPGLAIVFVVMGLNLLGDGLRDIFDPRLKGA